MTDALVRAASACWPALARTLEDLEEAKADLASTRTELEYVKSAHGGTARTAMDQLREQQWQQLPAKIILLRHGQGEHNVDPTILREDSANRKPDNLCELTSLGRSQARAAGERIRKLLDNRGVISVVVSPFERTLQTLYALQQELGDVEVRRVHIDPRVREQEFGNYQRDMDQLSKEANEARREPLAAGFELRSTDPRGFVRPQVGRFYYRRPTGESGADVYDRAATFWDSLLSLALNPKDMFLPASQMPNPDDALLVVTHGLTMRLLLMRYFSWSAQTMAAVYNPGNCDSW